MSDPVEPPPRLSPKQLVGALVRLAALPVCFLVPAGTWRWPEAWALSGVYNLWAAILIPRLARNDPHQLAERAKGSMFQEDQKAWDKVVTGLMGVVGLALIVVPGFDAVRFGWSSLPLWVEILGLVLTAPALAWVGWVMATNTYLSRVVKIDEARGHTVITDGPYRFVRHPMYTAVSITIIAMPLALGSIFGLVPAVLMLALMVLRTAKEDRMLHEELEGYAEYAAATRYRLIPGIW